MHWLHPIQKPEPKSPLSRVIFDTVLLSCFGFMTGTIAKGWLPFLLPAWGSLCKKENSQKAERKRGI